MGRDQGSHSCLFVFRSAILVSMKSPESLFGASGHDWFVLIYCPEYFFFKNEFAIEKLTVFFPSPYREAV